MNFKAGEFPFGLTRDDMAGEIRFAKDIFHNYPIIIEADEIKQPIPDEKKFCEEIVSYLSEVLL